MSTLNGKDYDVAFGLSEVRRMMRSPNPITMQAVELGETYARLIRQQFEGRDLALVGEVLMVSAASLRPEMSNAKGRFYVDAQAIAAVLVTDAAADPPPPMAVP